MSEESSDEVGGLEASSTQEEPEQWDESMEALPRVLLMGPRRGGKTSIQVRTVEVVG
jgi:hypothetical protein